MDIRIESQATVKTTSQFTRFFIVSLGGLILAESILFILTEFVKFHYQFSNACAIGIVTFYNYIVNKIWTFREVDEATSYQEVSGQFLKYCVVGGIGAVLNILLTHIFTEIFQIWYILSNTIAVCCAIISNFLLNKFWTFSSEEKFNDKLLGKKEK